MRSKIVILAAILLSTVSSTAQDQSSPKTPHYVIVPSESVLLVTASQPNCPIEIANGKLLNPVDGSRRAAFQYELRNRGTKPIKYVSVYTLDSAGTGGGPLYNGHVMDKPLMPGQKLLVGEQSLEIATLTPELRKQLRLAGPLRAIVVLMIERVEYTDGSVFSDKGTIKALGDYFVDINYEEINSKADPPSLSASPSREKLLHSSLAQSKDSSP